MIRSIQYKNLTWLDVKKPRPTDIDYLKKTFHLHPLLVQEFTCPSQRPRAEEFANCLYVVFHTPLYDNQKKFTYPGEIDIVILENFLITVHQDNNLPLNNIFSEIKKSAARKEEAMSKTAGFLFYFVMEKLIASCFPKIDHINEKIDFIEKEIFNENEKDMVRYLSFVKRDILSFRRILKPQKNILESLLQKKYRLLEDELNDYFQDLIGTNIRVWNALENTKEVAESLEETNNSILSHKINETIRFLSAVSLITFALSVTTGIFGMVPIESFPLVKEKAFFWLALLFMLIIALTIVAIFRKKRWL